MVLLALLLSAWTVRGQGLTIGLNPVADIDIPARLGTIKASVEAIRKQPEETRVEALRALASRTTLTPIERAYVQAELAGALILSLDLHADCSEAYDLMRDAWATLSPARLRLDQRQRFLSNLILAATRSRKYTEAAAWLKLFDQNYSLSATKLRIFSRLGYASYIANALPLRAIDCIDRIESELRQAGTLSSVEVDDPEMLPPVLMMTRMVALSRLGRLSELESAVLQLEKLSVGLGPELRAIVLLWRGFMTRYSENVDIDRFTKAYYSLPPESKASARPLFLKCLMPHCSKLSISQMQDLIWALSDRDLGTLHQTLQEAAALAGVVTTSEDAQSGLNLLSALKIMIHDDRYEIESEDRAVHQSQCELSQYRCLLVGGYYAAAAKLATEANLIVKFANVREKEPFQGFLKYFGSGSFENPFTQIDSEMGGLGSVEDLGARAIAKLFSEERVRQSGQLGEWMLREARADLSRAGEDPSARAEAYCKLYAAFGQLMKDEPGREAALKSIRDDAAWQWRQSAIESGDQFKIADSSVRVAIDAGDTPEGANLRRFALFAVRKDERRQSRMVASLQLGELFEKCGDSKRAEECFTEAERLSRSEAPAMRGLALGKLGGVLCLTPRTEALGIVLLKQAVNLIQEERSRLSVTLTSLQTRLRDSLRSIYVRLAEALLAHGRFREAEEVLAMLKEGEEFGFVRGSDTVDPFDRRLALVAREAVWWGEWEKLRSRASEVLLEAERLQLNRRRTAEEEKRLGVLRADSIIVNRGIDALITAIAAEVSGQRANKDAAGNARADSLSSSDRLDGTLLRLDEELRLPTAAIYVLVTSTRIHEILVTRNGRLVLSHKIPIAETLKKVARFLTALRNPTADPRPAGKELYDLLVAPLESDLEARGIRYIMWSLDGALRYVPMAALWDGKRYLVEKYPMAFFNPARLDVVTENARLNWRVAAFGSTRGGHGFSGLPSVKDEVEAVVSILEGRQFLDSDFTAPRVQNVIESRSEPILHLATHFRLREDVEHSSLVLGNGEELSLQDMRLWSLGNNRLFAHLELLYLSACSTAESVTDTPQGDGQEVDSFAGLALKLGAKSVIATLWPVADSSTAAAASAFYKAHTSTLGKADALRSVQVAMITGALQALGNGASRSDPTVKPPVRSAEPPFKVDPKRPFAHPYYWAPFQLFGNWK